MGTYLMVLNPFALNFWKMSCAMMRCRFCVIPHHEQRGVGSDVYSPATVRGPVAFGNETRRSCHIQLVSIAAVAHEGSYSV